MGIVSSNWQIEIIPGDGCYRINVVVYLKWLYYHMLSVYLYIYLYIYFQSILGFIPIIIVESIMYAITGIY